MTETKEKNRQKLGIFCCIAGGVGWGLSGTCGEALFSQYPIDTSWVTAVRMTVAGTLLLLFALAKHSLDFKALGKDKKGIMEIVLFALAGLALCQYAYLSAIKWTNSGTATVIQNLSIVFIAVYVCLTTRTKPDKKDGILYSACTHRCLAPRDRRKTRKYGADTERTLLGTDGGHRRGELLAAFQSSGGTFWKYSGDRTWDVDRGSRALWNCPGMEGSGWT